MKEVTLNADSLVGLSVRTNNANEMQPATAKIGTLHQRFAQQVKVAYEQGLAYMAFITNTNPTIPVISVC
ncbi:MULTISPECIES: hypothetical protein [Marinomonas]|uniref:Uncharacterized protein n=1 Tax=Marinomonas rhodophyticola TaxID=2992803 RepID=A0ABT3KCA8_9GAMM|nr:hypothetical protein [Marinomonas sp. KJ51-3]MCW4628167.1 hypothetical protein [Marinomonas sp. KJ51-3]